MSKRCEWAGDDPLSIAYHDKEWGVPVHADQELFEFLLLEGAQAGLSWITVLRKRENYRRAFDNFSPEIIARYDDTKLEALRQDPGIIRNKLKIRSAVQNAQAFLRVQKEHGSFDAYLWEFVKGRPIVNTFQRLSQVPASTPLSEQISKDLKQRGFNFVGPTIVYAYLQAVGVVNDHTTACFRYRDLGGGK